MSVIYLVALTAVSMALLGALIEAAWAVSRKPVWSQPNHALRRVITMERRTLTLPYVGVDRRGATAADPHGEVDRLAA